MLRFFVIAVCGFPSLAFSADPDSFLALCEQTLESRLSSPSSYHRVHADVYFEPELKGDNAKYVLPNMDCEGKPAAFNPNRDCSGHPNAITATSGHWRASIQFDAQNGFGGNIRGSIACEARVPFRESSIPSDAVRFVISE